MPGPEKMNTSSLEKLEKRWQVEGAFELVLKIQKEIF